jgi:hypothetical protein
MMKAWCEKPKQNLPAVVIACQMPVLCKPDEFGDSSVVCAMRTFETLFVPKSRNSK